MTMRQRLDDAAERYAEGRITVNYSQLNAAI